MQKKEREEDLMYGRRGAETDFRNCVAAVEGGNEGRATEEARVEHREKDE